MAEKLKTSDESGVPTTITDLLYIATGRIVRPIREQNDTEKLLREKMRGEESELFFNQLILTLTDENEAIGIEWEEDARTKFNQGLMAIIEHLDTRLREAIAANEIDTVERVKDDLLKLLLKGLGYISFNSVEEVQKVMQGLQKEEKQKKVKIRMF